MTIRILGEQDADAWWRLRLIALETEPAAFGKSTEEHRSTPIETIARRFRNPTCENFTLGAFESDVLIGMATFVRETGLKERHKGRIYGVYVDRAHRRRGVGQALIGSLLEKAKENDSLEQILLAVTTSQTAARQLYARRGFVSFGIEPKALKAGAAYFDEDHMILRFG